MEKNPKKIKTMFNSIAGTYDLLNHIFSLNIDSMWRKKAVNSVKHTNPEKILDVAAGTFDLSISFAKEFPEANIFALDFAIDMLTKGLHKIKKHKIYPINGDGLTLPFKDNSFDIVSIAFGIRNLESMEKGLTEFLRVLKPNGTLLVLEFTPNKNLLFNLYSGVIMPLVGKIVSGDKEAYSYLHKSVKNFPNAEKLKIMLQQIGFINSSYKKMTFSIAALHKGQKPN
jgi:demethylmenaquinone methyltransferase/2-methoxy-6-polyprenyl-1,4-benzoquinol methylase